MERKRSDFEFEVALSFAGEQREYVDEFAAELKAQNIEVFYDTYEKVRLWGKDLYQYLNDIYKNRCLFTIVFISEDYAKKRWTKHELRSAQTRAFNENSEYILPVRFDNTELPGFNETIGYLSIEGMSPKELAALTKEKLIQFGSPRERNSSDKVEIPDYKKLTPIQRINPDELIGRKKDLKKLHKLLTEKKKVVVVNGMGGIGKTTLAAAYTFQYHDYYKKLVWITQSQEDITNDFVQNPELIRSLKIDTEGKQADQLFAEILHTLSNIPDRPKLLVIDNAFEGLEEHLDRLPSQPEWDLLVTSRESIDGLYAMPLDFLSEAEAIALFKKHCSRISDLEEIKELVNIVELHTLTVEILALTAQEERISVKKLKQALETDLESAVKTRHSELKPIEKITFYLGTIFDFSALSEDEIWLLKNFCALPSEFHSYELLINLINPEAVDKEGNFAKTLNLLVKKGWILEDHTGDNYRLHRVIGETILIKSAIDTKEISGLRDRLIQLLKLDQTKDNPIDKFTWIPFGHALLKVLKDSETSNKSTLQNHLASALQDLGEYQNAKTLLQKAMISNEKNFGELHPNTAVSYSNLALVIKDLGDYQGAKDLLQKALISDEKNFGELHPSTARTYSNLALVLKDLGEFIEAIRLAEKALRVFQQVLPEGHPHIDQMRGNLEAIKKAAREAEAGE